MVFIFSLIEKTLKKFIMLGFGITTHQNEKERFIKRGNYRKTSFCATIRKNYTSFLYKPDNF
jgi:hypothetical protein